MKQAHMNGTQMPYLTPCYDQNLISQYILMIMMNQNIIFAENKGLTIYF